MQASNNGRGESRLVCRFLETMVVLWQRFMGPFFLSGKARVVSLVCHGSNAGGCGR